MCFQRVLILIIVPTLLLACGSPREPDSELVRLAVVATIEARPSPDPVIVEVTRIVAVEPSTETSAATVAQNSDGQNSAQLNSPPTAQIAPTPLLPTQAPPTVAPPTEPPPPEPLPTEPPVAVEQPTAEASTEVAQNRQSVASAQAGSCPTSSTRTYDLIEMEAQDTNHLDYLHGDLNLALRGRTTSSSELSLIDYSGATDGNAPKLNGLFADKRQPPFVSAHQVYDWNWACGADGCPGDLLGDFDVTLLGVGSNPGEEIRIPSRGPEIYGGGYVAAVLYADTNQITLAYSRDGTVANGYAVHIDNLCVDTNLLAQYRAGNSGGRGQLPLIRNDETVGTAAGTELLVAIRDRGKFMDPRSRKDWWQ